jgi:hypothetical protein
MVVEFGRQVMPQISFGQGQQRVRDDLRQAAHAPTRQALILDTTPAVSIRSLFVVFQLNAT